MALKCTSCFGELRYDISSRKLKCQSCGSFFPVEEFDNEISGIDEMEQQDGSYYAVDVYQCESCGAELTAPAEQIVAYCTYCGSEAVLVRESEPALRPKKIIPFSKTKQEVEKKFEETIKKQPYLPKEFKDAGFLEGFRGIYIPYWRKVYKVNDLDVTIPGTKDYTSGSYDYHETYEMKVQFGGNKEVYYDASYAFDDTVAAEIAPFHSHGSRKFHEGYLAGFYADQATVPAELYDELALKSLEVEILPDLETKTKVTPTDGKWRKELKFEKTRDITDLFPVWFLTWRRGKRVAYSVVNGQTGKMSIDLPVDYGAFFKCTAIWAAVLFLILSVLPLYFLPVKIAAVSMFSMLMTSIVLKNEIKRINWLENHTFDLGYLFVNRQKKRQVDPEKEKDYRTKQAKKLIHHVSTEKGLLVAKPGGGLQGLQKVLLIIYLVILGIACFSVETPDGVRGAMVLGLILQGLISDWVQMFRIRNKLVLASALVPLGTLCWCIWASGHWHPQDIWYYAIAMVMLGTMILNILTAIMYFNYLATRPVPDFFHRKGANHGKE